MEMEEPDKIDFENRDFSFIDLSSINNFQFSDLNTYELPEAVSAEEEADTRISINATEQFPELHETTDPEITQRNGRYNLRKSLAWDNAFFISAGVLDPEELSTMLKGTEKGKKHLLPGIEEDITVSTESISTLESDSLTMDGVETELFVDIRASIQRSSEKASNLTNSSRYIEAVETDNTAISPLKKKELSSQSKNPNPILKKNSGQQIIKMPKYQPKANIVKLRSGQAVKQDSSHSQVTESMAKIGESNLLLPKPPKAISEPIPASTAAVKRDSTVSNRAKSGCGSSKLVSDKGTQPSKVSFLSGARRPLSKPALSPKSSSLHSSTACRVQSTRSCTSSDSSSSISSETSAKPSLMAARRNPVKTSNAGTASPGSIPKTQSRAALKNKPPPTLSAYLMSTKISSSVSPASSISEWSSASASSSSSMVNRRSNNSRTSLDTNSCRSMDGDTILSGPRNHSTDRTADGRISHGIVLPHHSSAKSSTRTGTLQAPTKPSGLRMPSPKIGFFDGVKALARTPNGTLQPQSGLQTVIPKSGAANCSSAWSPNIKLKSGKIATARTVTALAKIKDDSLKAASPAPFQDVSHASGDNLCVLTDVKDSPSLSLEVKGLTTGENCSKPWKVQVENGAKQVVESGAGAIMNKNLGGLNNEADFTMHKHMGTRDAKIAPVEGINHLGYIGQRVDEDVLVDPNHLKNHSYPIYKTSDKENGRAEDQGEGLRACNGDANPHFSSSMAEILKDTSDCASLSFSDTASKSAAHRAPFTLKNFSCNNAPERESASHAADKTVFLLPLSDQKENS